MTDAATDPAESEASLATLALDALYARDELGRLLHPRNPHRAAPRLHFTRTTSGNHWCFGTALPEDLVARIEPLLAAEPVEADATRWEHHEPTCLTEVRAVLAAHRPLEREYRGPAFTFPASVAVSHVAVEVLKEPRGTSTAAELAWVAEAVPDDQPLVVARDAEGRVVAQCHSARRSESAAHAGVETALDARRAGLGAGVVARWASEVRALGLVPFYGTWWENEASRALAARLGLEMFAEDWHVD